MFNSDEFEVDDIFKRHQQLWDSGSRRMMELMVGLAVVVGVAIVLALLCRCCRSTKFRGRVLQPAPDPNSTVPAPPGLGAPYPQQQYNTVTLAVPTVTSMPSHSAMGAPYPHPGPGVGYPGGAGYPVGAPYPVVAPYPAGPYPGMMPQPSAAPSAPDAHTFIGIAPAGWHAQALPPSYDQVMSTEPKHPPYNPYVPH